jgi:hypothetical protein
MAAQPLSGPASNQLSQAEITPSALFEKRLEGDLEYQRALFQLEQARLTVKQKERVFLPYLNLSTSAYQGGSSGRVSLANGQVQPFGISLDARLMNVLGTDISVSLPFVWSDEAGSEIRFPELSVSRKLFVETRPELLEARAEAVSLEYKLGSTKMAVWTDLVAEIFDRTYYWQVKSLQEEHADTLQSLMEESRDERSKRELKRQWYILRKELLSSESALHKLSVENPRIPAEQAPALQKEMEALVPRYEKLIAETIHSPPEQKNLEALRLSLEAAERKEALWFLPFLPNPAFSAGISYDLEREAVDWSISVSFDISIFDRGERSIAAEARKRGRLLAELELEQAARSSLIASESALNRREIAEIDYEISLLDLEEAREQYEQAQQLSEEGFISEDQLVLASIDFRMAELNAAKKRHQYGVALLSILQEFGIGPGAFLEE